MRRMTSLATAAAVVLTSFGLTATPAEARGRYGGWGHYYQRDRVSAGDVIGGLLIIGTIAAIASSASRDKQARRDADYRYVPPYRDDQRQDAPDYQRRDDRPVMPYGSGDAEARAADACSWAVEGEMGDDARVDSITDTRPANGGDGWYVTGTASRSDGEVRSFGCSFRNGRVLDVSFG